MRSLTRKNGGWLRKTTVTGLLPLLFLASFPGCTAKHMPDWSKVQAVVPDTKTEVQLHEEEALPEDNENIEGRFDTATADSLTLKFEDGRTDTFQKQYVRKVSTHRPIWKRWPGWITLVAASVAMGIVATSEDIDVAPYGLLLPVGLPTLLAFYGSSPTERVYEVAPKHTDPMWSTGPSATEAKKPTKSK